MAESIETRQCRRCGKIVTGKGYYCTSACRQAEYRDNCNNCNTPTVTSNCNKPTVTSNKIQNLVTPQPEHTPALGITDECSESKYATRTNPELLNYGPWMNADQLERHRQKHNLSKYHNRVPIPGDYDYAGVAVGSWPNARQGQEYAETKTNKGGSPHAGRAGINTLP